MPSRTLTIALALAASLFTASGKASPAACKNPQGVQYAAYQNVLNVTAIGSRSADDGAGYPDFDPTVYKTIKPVLTGVTADIGVSGSTDYGEDYYPYGNKKPVLGGTMVLDHRGYIKAPTTGNYTFTIPDNPNDNLLFWVGSLAYSGWTRPNDNLETCSVLCPAPVFYTFALKKGTYTPFRLMYANGDYNNSGGWSFDASLTDPNGNLLLGGNSTRNPSIVQYGCSGTPPQFPVFGQET